jgi:hypothetical protein
MLGVLVLWGAVAVLTPQEVQALDQLGGRLATIVYANWGRDSEKDSAMLQNASSPRWQARFVEILQGCAARGGGCPDPMTCLPRGPVTVVATRVAEPDGAHALLDVLLRDQTGNKATARWTLLLETRQIDDVRCLQAVPPTAARPPPAPPAPPAPPPAPPAPAAGAFDTNMFAYQFVEQARRLEMEQGDGFFDFIVQNTTPSFQRDLLKFMEACQVPGTDTVGSRSCRASYFTCLPMGVAGVPSAAKVDKGRSYAADQFTLQAGDVVWRITVISENGQVRGVGCQKPAPPVPPGSARGRCTGVPIPCGAAFCGAGCFPDTSRGARGCTGAPPPCPTRTIATCFDGCFWDSSAP